MTQSNERGILQGFMIATAINFLVGILYGVLWNFVTANPQTPKAINNILTYLFWGIGFSQLIHIVPIVLWLKKKRRFARMKGVIIGAALTALLCGGCFIVVFPGFSNYFIRR